MDVKELQEENDRLLEQTKKDNVIARQLVYEMAERDGGAAVLAAAGVDEAGLQQGIEYQIELAKNKGITLDPQTARSNFIKSLVDDNIQAQQDERDKILGFASTGSDEAWDAAAGSAVSIIRVAQKLDPALTEDNFQNQIKARSQGKIVTPPKSEMDENNYQLAIAAANYEYEHQAGHDPQYGNKEGHYNGMQIHDLGIRILSSSEKPEEVVRKMLEERGITDPDKQQAVIDQMNNQLTAHALNQEPVQLHLPEDNFTIIVASSTWINKNAPDLVEQAGRYERAPEHRRATALRDQGYDGQHKFANVAGYLEAAMDAQRHMENKDAKPARTDVSEQLGLKPGEPLNAAQYELAIGAMNYEYGSLPGHDARFGEGSNNHYAGHTSGNSDIRVAANKEQAEAYLKQILADRNITDPKQQEMLKRQLDQQAESLDKKPVQLSFKDEKGQIVSVIMASAEWMKENAPALAAEAARYERRHPETTTKREESLNAEKNPYMKFTTVAGGAKAELEAENARRHEKQEKKREDKAAKNREKDKAPPPDAADTPQPSPAQSPPQAATQAMHIDYGELGAVALQPGLPKIPLRDRDGPRVT